MQKPLRHASEHVQGLKQTFYHCSLRNGDLSTPSQLKKLCDALQQTIHYTNDDKAQQTIYHLSYYVVAATKAKTSI